MDYDILLLNVIYAFLGLVVLIIAYKIFDWVEHKINFAEQINHGNIAAAIFLSAIVIALSIIIAGALG
ncbi:MAG: DUF350 domain-containing protein [Bacteroidota bacterium]